MILRRSKVTTPEERILGFGITMAHVRVFLDHLRMPDHKCSRGLGALVVARLAIRIVDEECFPVVVGHCLGNYFDSCLERPFVSRRAPE